MLNKLLWLFLFGFLNGVGLTLIEIPSVPFSGLDLFTDIFGMILLLTSGYLIGSKELFKS